MSNRCWVLVPRANRFFRDIPDKKVVIERLEFSREFSTEYKAALKYLLERCKKGFKPSASDVVSIGCSIGDEIRDDLENKFEKGSTLRNKIEDMYRNFLSMFEDWFTFIDDYIFNVERSKPSKAIEFFNCIVLNDCGVIDYGETAVRLLAHTKIGDLDKLKIACVHCLEDKVRAMVRIVEFPNSFADGYNEKTARIMEFWKKYSKNDKYRAKVDDLIDEVDYDNVTAVKFFFDKLNAGQKCYNLPYVFSNSSVYTQCTMLNEMNAEQQLNILSKSGGHMLRKLRNSFIWSDYYFIVAAFAREVIPDEQYYDIIREAGNDMMDDFYEGHDKNQTILHTMWEYAPQHARQYFYQQKDVEFMFHYLRKIYDFDFLREVVAGGTMEFKKRFFQSEDGVRIISYLTCNDYFDEFNKLYKASFPRVDDAIEFKIKFVCSESGFVTTFQDSIYNKNKKNFDTILKKIFLNDRGANKFKKQFLFNTTYLDMLYWLTKKVFYTKSYEGQLRKSIDLEAILVVLRWFLGTKKEIDNFVSTRLCHVKEVKKAFLEVLRDGGYNLLDMFLKWAFKEDPRTIAAFKRSLFDNESEKQWHEFVYEMIKKDNSFEEINKLMYWIDTNENRQSEIKKIIVKNLPKMRHLRKYLLYEGRFELANAFLTWCGVGSEDEIAYKKELFDGINWWQMACEILSGRSFSADEIDTYEQKMQKCMDIVDWMGSAISKETRTEFRKKWETKSFKDDDLDDDEDET